jgi:lipopolysaccharide transport system permease protein
MTPVVEAFRVAFLGAGTVDARHLLYSFVFMLAVVLLGTIVFNRVEQTFMDTV